MFFTAHVCPGRVTNTYAERENFIQLTGRLQLHTATVRELGTTQWSSSSLARRDRHRRRTQNGVLSLRLAIFIKNKSVKEIPWCPVNLANASRFAAKV